MELCAGGLADRIKEQGPLAEKVCEGTGGYVRLLQSQCILQMKLRCRPGDRMSPLLPPCVAKDARKVMKQLAEAVSYMHENGEEGNHGNISSTVYS